MKTKQFKVIMLATDKATNLMLNGKRLFDIDHSMVARENSGYVNQHLYIISDSEIKEGDWYISFLESQPKPLQHKNNCGKEFYEHIKTHKIIVSTDNSLKLPHNGIKINRFENYIELPLIPESFVSAYIKAYNEGNKIEEVSLEMLEDYDVTCLGQVDNGKWFPKTRSDNSVIIHQSKMYSKAEVIEQIKNAYQRGYEDRDFDIGYGSNREVCIENL